MRARAGGRVLFLVGVLVCSFVLLAPIECVGYCDGVEDAGGEGRCFETCTTLLGHPAPLGELWFLVPLAAVVATRLVSRRRR